MNSPSLQQLHLLVGHTTQLTQTEIERCLLFCRQSGVIQDVNPLTELIHKRQINRRVSWFLLGSLLDYLAAGKAVCFVLLVKGDHLFRSFLASDYFENSAKHLRIVAAVVFNFRRQPVEGEYL